MIPSDKLLIPHDEDHFEHVGKLPDGTQFLAFVTGAFPGGVKYPDPSSEVASGKQWLAVVHRFDYAWGVVTPVRVRARSGVSGRGSQCRPRGPWRSTFRRRA